MEEERDSNRAKVTLYGKIHSIRRVGKNEDIVETIIITPSGDQYGYPNKYCVFSKKKLGVKDDEVQVEAEIWCRPWKDRNNNWNYPHSLWAVN